MLDQDKPGIQELPKIEIVWNAEAQTAGLHFKATEFKTWDYIIAVLDMARSIADNNRRIAHAQQMQQIAMQQMADAQLAQQVNGSRLLKGR